MPIRTHKEARREGGKKGQATGDATKHLLKMQATKRCLAASWWQLNAWPAHCQRLPQVKSRLVAAAAAATQWQPQITPKYGATQRIESIADSFQFAVFRFIYLKLHFAAASFCVFYFCFHFLFVFYFSFASATAAFHCALLFAVVFLLLSLFLGLCFAVIGAIAPGNHCQQLMKAIVGVAAF